MGVVYLAHDTKLDRPVAIKSLPAEVTSSPVARSRFQREARLLASLNHSNIATIYEEIEEAEGVAYLVLEYVPGKTLAEQMDRGGVTLEEALSIALQIAEAISAAHNKGVIHRDLKPGNIKITPEGKVKVLDFGIAKMVGGQPVDRRITTVTQPGQTIGTPGYMSPEQAVGKEVDFRSDIWSFGCVLYEMLTGRRAFAGQTTSDVLESVLKAEPEWEAIPAEVGPVLRGLTEKCLQKDPGERYQSAAGLCQDLLEYQATVTAPTPKALNVKAMWQSLRKPRVGVACVIIFAVLCVTAFWLINQSAKVRSARKALPEIERFIEQHRYLAAFSLARQVEKYIPKDPTLIKLWPRICRDFSLVTAPAGADIFFKEYSAIDGQWEYLGRSPLENIRFPHGVFRWKIQKEGFETRELVAGKWTDAPNRLRVELWGKGKFPPDMVRIPAGVLEAGAYAVGQAGKVEVPTYWIDKYEVTNERFKEFVNAGGYENQQYWKYKFIKDGREVSWEEAMSQFRDKTGRRGPSTWEGGTYPRTHERYPASGVSWYEAAAYAEFAGKSLPTTYHWSHAACTQEAIVIIPLSNFESSGPAPVGSHPGMGCTGLYDMAGNVKEWCWNATDGSGDRRFIPGGAWSDATYMFGDRATRSPWDRSPVNGFRCVEYPGGKKEVPEVLFCPVATYAGRDYSKETPVPTETFRSWLRQLYSYDRTALNPVVEEVDESWDYWRREKLTFDAAYGDERVIAYLFLPKRVEPPYQTVVYFPGAGGYRDQTFGNLPQRPFTEFVIMSGRALLFPVYEGMFERKSAGRGRRFGSRPIADRDHIIHMAKDLMRSVDYLETRLDIEREKIAYYGMSSGARLGSIMLAVEGRIKVGLLMLGGFSQYEKHPAIDEINFAPRVKVPVLMINGREDAIFPLKTSQMPMFEFLGTPNGHKEHRVYPGGHDLLGLFSRQIRDDVLNWLDRYLGPVD
jgi:formylglycine-generating enzyme required for sulfatase activity/cephalosporin-C deacetylase-like acetyl esterase